MTFDQVAGMEKIQRVINRFLVSLFLPSGVASVIMASLGQNFN